MFEVNESNIAMHGCLQNPRNCFELLQTIFLFNSFIEQMSDVLIKS